ncbi:dienelactone hydrolase [Mycena latifolia]|nr:dienelactone hydrolase [Mycena latifolia]
MSCPDCFKGAVLEGEPTGTIASEFESAYFATGGTSKRAIILLTDIFGLPLKNSKILADNFAMHLQCDVWVPDLFAGHPPVTEAQMKSLPDRAGVKMSFFDILKLIWTALPSIPSMFRNRPSVVEARTISVRCTLLLDRCGDLAGQFVKKLQEAKKYERLGAIGYCFGGGIATRLGASTDLFNSIVLAHPSPPSDAHIKAIKAPTAWSCAEDDMAIKPARLTEIEALYEERRGKDTFVEFEIQVFKGTAHGFAARPNFAYPDVKEGFEKAFQQAVDWFNKTLPA